MLKNAELDWIGLQEEKRSYKDCAGEKGPSVPSACVGLRETYFQCKRGQVRFRGLMFFMLMYLLNWGTGINHWHSSI